jgi:hypothetical protein
MAFVRVIVIAYVGFMAGATIGKGASGKPVSVTSSKAEILTNSDIIRMSNAHLSDAAIIGKIDFTHGYFDVRSDALVALKNAGVSNNVIKAVVQRNLASTVSDIPRLRLFFEGFELLMTLGFVAAALKHP